MREFDEFEKTIITRLINESGEIQYFLSEWFNQTSKVMVKWKKEATIEVWSDNTQNIDRAHQEVVQLLQLLSYLDRFELLTKIPITVSRVAKLGEENTQRSLGTQCEGLSQVFFDNEINQGVIKFDNMLLSGNQSLNTFVSNGFMTSDQRHNKNSAYQTWILIGLTVLIGMATSFITYRQVQIAKETFIATKTYNDSALVIQRSQFEAEKFEKMEDAKRQKADLRLRLMLSSPKLQVSNGNFSRDEKGEKLTLDFANLGEHPAYITSQSMEVIQVQRPNRNSNAYYLKKIEILTMRDASLYVTNRRETSISGHYSITQEDFYNPNVDVVALGKIQYMNPMTDSTMYYYYSVQMNYSSMEALLYSVNSYESKK